MELLYPLYRLPEEDVAVTVAGLDDQPVTGKKGHGPVPVDCPVGQVAADDFDALVIPGGYAPDKLRRSQTVLALVRAFADAGKPIAFICHAGWVPISAKIVKGRRATSVAAIRDDMVNAGVNWVDQAAVVDGNLISARTPADRSLDEGAAGGIGRARKLARLAEAPGRRRTPAGGQTARTDTTQRALMPLGAWGEEVSAICARADWRDSAAQDRGLATEADPGRSA